MMTDKDSRPIRTRGAVGFPATKVEKGPTVVPTRGPVRTRGGATGMRSEARARTTTLEALVSDIRARVNDLPLTILIHGWGGSGAARFFGQLRPMAREDDAFWLTPSASADRSTPGTAELARASVLDPDKDSDQGIYNNLIGDIVFFPAAEESEIGRAAHWRKRARAVIVDASGPCFKAVLSAASEAGLFAYRWSGGNSLEER